MGRRCFSAAAPLTSLINYVHLPELVDAVKIVEYGYFITKPDEVRQTR
jgi:hypothetical protein